MKYSVFITGSNRGIGLEFVKQYAEKDWLVYASCRNPEQAVKLQRLSKKYKNIHVIQLDVSSEKQVNSLTKKFQRTPIDVLINNAAILDKKRILFKNLTPTHFINLFLINTISPLLITRALLPSLNLGKLKIVASLSSLISSLTENYGDKWNHYTYKTSKTALNMAMSCFAIEPKYAEIKVILLDPGWVKTDMGGKDATISVQESVSGMIKVMASKKLKSRIFINNLGKEQAW